MTEGTNYIVTTEQRGCLNTHTRTHAHARTHTHTHTHTHTLTSPTLQPLFALVTHKEKNYNNGRTLTEGSFIFSPPSQLSRLQYK